MHISKRHNNNIRVKDKIDIADCFFKVKQQQKKRKYKREREREITNKRNKDRTITRRAIRKKKSQLSLCINSEGTDYA